MEAANHSLAANTWRSYSTAEKHIMRVEKETGVRMSFPFTLRTTLAYIGYLLNSKESGGRGIQGKSVEKYISALRLIHMKKGFFSPHLRPEIVGQIIRGACNRDQIKKRMQGKTGRLAMTPELMLKLKNRLAQSKMRLSKKRIIWAVSTISWAGALRIHEILSKHGDKFDPMTTLLASDITSTEAMVGDRKVKALKMVLKHPKEERLSAGVIIDLFATGDFMCPVKAHTDWLRDKVVNLSTLKPMYRLADGQAYTGAAFNKDLRNILKQDVDYEKSPVTAHSFRAGLATFMAKAGYEDSEIMKIGRWHSEAFLAYIKTPREVRAKLAEELASRVAESIRLEE